MLNLWGSSSLDRRELLRVGGVALGGLTLPMLPANTAIAAGAKPKSFGQAKNCIILYLSGGPAQLDTFDPKPDAPDDIRGEFTTIQTTLPGMRFTELLPQRREVDAQVGARPHDVARAQRPRPRLVLDVHRLPVPRQRARREHDEPPGHAAHGLVRGEARARQRPAAACAIVPHRMDVAGGRRAGQFAGSLGPKYDPLLTGGNPNDDDFKLDHLPLVANESPDAVKRRLSLVDQLNAETKPLNDAGRERHHQGLAGEGGRRDLVGRGAEGGRSVRRDPRRSASGTAATCSASRCMLGRRLLDAGARLVQCNWQRTQGINGFAWDTHWNNFTAHKDDLVPPFDQAFHALMTDLDATGKLDETLVVVAAEFGRSPKITQSNAGREHWPECYSVLFAGGGIKGGQVYGASRQDRRPPRDRPGHPGRLHRDDLPLPRHRPARTKNTTRAAARSRSRRATRSSSESQSPKVESRKVEGAPGGMSSTLRLSTL